MMIMLTESDLRCTNGGWCKCLCTGQTLIGIRSGIGDSVARVWSLGKVPDKNYCKQACSNTYRKSVQEMFDCVNI